MKAEGIHLSWIVVKDVEKALKFYTEIVGLELLEFNKEFGWAELKGKNGCTLGIAQENLEHNEMAGKNAVVSITVADLAKAIDHFKKKGVKLIGDVLEIPNHVKMQTFQDVDGNTFQIVECLE